MQSESFLLLSIAIFYSSKCIGAQYVTRNPLNAIDNDSYPDPWVILVNDTYFYCGSEDSARLYITFSENLQDILTKQKTYIYIPPPGFNYSQELWAPELHFLQNRWYVYFAADDGRNENHRMFVLEGGSDPLNPLNGAYSLKSQLKPQTDNWGIDGSPFEYNNEIYYVWSGWPGNLNVQQCIYIAKMSNPYTIVGERVEISCPTEQWEKMGSGGGLPFINEGPQVLISNRQVNIVYSASGSWTDDYCLGTLSNSNGNLMDKLSWVKRGPSFKKFGKVYGTGHASFTHSKDGQQNWIVYHAAKYMGGGWNRNVRIQQFVYHGDFPYFGEPIQPGVRVSLDKSSLIKNGFYKLKSKYDNLTISVIANSVQDAASIVTSPDDGRIGNIWTITSGNNGFYKLKSAASLKCLDNAGASLEAGNKLIQWSENGNDAQWWRFENMNDGYYKIFNKRSLLHIDCPGGEDIPCVQWYSSNDDSQLFQLIPLI